MTIVLLFFILDFVICFLRFASLRLIQPDDRANQIPITGSAAPPVSILYRIRRVGRLCVNYVSQDASDITRLAIITLLSSRSFSPFPTNLL
ncbi:hypothetical protein F4823DRAFT_522836 [Ustulina deusta]|nr:hypothetical protein F4823DRAFT_522836 [Ustulina deusta]